MYDADVTILEGVLLSNDILIDIYKELAQICIFCYTYSLQFSILRYVYIEDWV